MEGTCSTSVGGLIFLSSVEGRLSRFPTHNITTQRGNPDPWNRSETLPIVIHVTRVQAPSLARTESS